MNIKFEIFALTKKDAKTISDELNRVPVSYNQFFSPFDFNLEVIEKILDNAIQDSYYGIKIGNDFAGFYMIRGLDEGFTIPSYGVWISPSFSGLGLASFTINHAFFICRLNKISSLMLKVHPENLKAKKIYEDNGFTQRGFDPKNSNLIYMKEL